MFTKTDIEKYFMAEKSGSLLILAIGIAGIATAAVLLIFLKTSFYRGVAIPLLVICLLLGVVGFTVYKRSDADRIRNVYAYDANPSALKQKEIPRMQTVVKNFVIYRWVEIALAITGLVLFFYFRNNEEQYFWKGFGLTLAIMALLAFTGDFFAEKRAKVYLNGMTAFIEAGRF